MFVRFDIHLSICEGLARLLYEACAVKIGSTGGWIAYNGTCLTGTVEHLFVFLGTKLAPVHVGSASFAWLVPESLYAMHAYIAVGSSRVNPFILS